jgi:hypothetical protein
MYFSYFFIFNENLVAIVNNVTSINFNKPIYLGQAILDYSKQLMYNFYYEIANKLWPDNEIVFGDTDSLVLKVASKDVYEDLEKIKEELDTSDYPEDHLALLIFYQEIYIFYHQKDLVKLYSPHLYAFHDE